MAPLSKKKENCNKLITSFFPKSPSKPVQRQVDENFNSQAIDSDPEDHEDDKRATGKALFTQRKPLAALTDPARALSIKRPVNDTPGGFSVFCDDDDDDEDEDDKKDEKGDKDDKKDDEIQDDQAPKNSNGKETQTETQKETQAVKIADTLTSQASVQSSPVMLPSDNEDDNDQAIEFGDVFQLSDDETTDPYLDQMSDPFITKTVKRQPPGLPLKRSHSNISNHEQDDDDNDLFPESFFTSPSSSSKKHSPARTTSFKDTTDSSPENDDDDENDNLFEFANDKSLAFSLSPLEASPDTHKTASPALDATISIPISSDGSYEAHLPYPIPRAKNTLEKYDL
ncbi:hypothetical protein BC940DRAFT_292503 [Gongronella butleri]|nr:hypothetical protein BC940DRAFT_292503 [Gongronella butleri]